MCVCVCVICPYGKIICLKDLGLAGSVQQEPIDQINVNSNFLCLFFMIFFFTLCSNLGDFFFHFMCSKCRSNRGKCNKCLLVQAIISLVSLKEWSRVQVLWMEKISAERVLSRVYVD